MKSMCLQANEQHPEAVRLRRKAVVVAASSVTLAGLPAILMNHGHRGLGPVFIGIQACLLVWAFLLIKRAKQAGRS